MSVYIETADTIDHCHKKIYDKYGKENVSILTNKITNVHRFFGLFSKDVAEVTFVVNEQTRAEQERGERSKKLSQKAMSKIDELNSKEETVKTKNQKPILPRKNISPYLNEPLFTESENAHIEQEKNETLQMLQTSVATLAERISQMNNGDIVNEKPAIKKLRAVLEVNAFSAEYIRTVIAAVSKKISLDQENNFELIQKLALHRIAASIKTSSLALPDASTEKSLGLNFSLVGPTGVGKTTTVAKLCAYFFLVLAKNFQRKFKVSAITIDNYRIGGWEQIQKYCTHMKIPLTVATNAAELQKAVLEGKERFDVTFIDTSGRSPNDTEKIDEMGQFFSELKNEVRIFLTVTASMQANDLINVINAYSSFDYFALIVTKTDETAYFGGLISALEKTKVPILYIATGQNVPKDIERANKKYFLKKLIGFDNLADYIEENFSQDMQDPIIWE